MKRFGLVPHIKEIVESPKAEMHMKEESGLTFWNIVKDIKGQKVRVIILKSGNRKVFLSVYPPPTE